MIAKQTNHGKAANNTATATARAATAKPCRRTDASATGRAGDVPAAALYTCHRCGHTWKPRGKATPKQCPACNSPNWNTPAASCLCEVCGHTWTARAKHRPRQCPACNSKRWSGFLRQIRRDAPLATFRADNRHYVEMIEKRRRKAKRARARNRRAKRATK